MNRRQNSILPNASDETNATKLAKDLYGKDVSAAKTVDQRKTLAAKLLQSAKDKGGDPATRFVLFRLAKNVATQAADAEGACAAIDEMGRNFRVDVQELKYDALHKCAAAATTALAHDLVAQQAASASDQAIAEDHYAQALPLFDLAISEAKLVKDAGFVSQLIARRADVELIVHAHDSLKSSFEVLAKTPKDPEANLVVGKFACFTKGDFTQGLPKLAAGSDPSLKALAESEAKGATSADQQLKLGDAWWSASETAAGAEKLAMEARAVLWYQAAIPGASGVERDRAAGRVKKGRENRERRFFSPIFHRMRCACSTHRKR